MKNSFQLKVSLGVTVVAALILGACSTSAPPAPGKVIQSQRSGDLVIDLHNEKGELAQGQNTFLLIFRSASKSAPVDVGAVTVGASMAMPGMAPMTASIELQPAGRVGEYSGKGDFAI